MESNRQRIKAFQFLDDSMAGSLHTKELIKRLREGRKQFGAIARINVNAALQLSGLNLELGDKSDKIIKYGGNITQTSENIRKDLSQTLCNTNVVMDEHEKLSDTLVEVVNNANDVLGSLKQNEVALHSMEGTCVKTADESKVMQEDMSELQKKIKDVKNAVMNINSISNQINLLSLNASVEAARAGAAGKGFGVVAGEIHKLYEATTVMIKEMEKSLHNIGVASDRSVKSVKVTAQSLEEIRENVSLVVERNQESSHKIGQVVSDISSVAATSQQISTSINEISSNMNHLDGEADSLGNMTQKLESLNQDLMIKIIKPIQTLEEKLDESTAIIGGMNRDSFYMLDNQVFVDSMQNAVKAHKSWVSTLKLIIDSCEMVPLQSDPKKCGFGHFYYAINPQKSDIVHIWKSVEEPHDELHKLGKEAERCIKGGTYQTLPSIYQRAVQLSEILIGKFNEMIFLSREYETRGESVFMPDM